MTTPPAEDRPGSLATAALVLAILSYLAVGPLASLPGLLVAAVELRRIRAGRSAAAGLLLTRVSLWLCAGNLLLFLLMCGVVALQLDAMAESFREIERLM